MMMNESIIPTDTSETELISMLVDGSEIAFKHIYNLYAPRLYAFCLQYTKNRGETDEIVQDAFIWLWNHRVTIRQRNSLKSLLFICVRHQLINAWRRNINSPVYEDFIAYRDKLQGESATDAGFDYEEFRQSVRRELGKLPTTQRRCIELSRFEGLSIRNVAERLALSEQTVKNSLSMG